MAVTIKSLSGIKQTNASLSEDLAARIREDILSGGVLEFEMGPRPLKRGAPRQADLPYSLSRE